MGDTIQEQPKIKFNPAILVHNIEKKNPDFRIGGPITIADINAEIANIDKGMEFIAHVSEKDHLLDAFLSEKENESQKDNE